MGLSFSYQIVQSILECWIAWAMLAVLNLGFPTDLEENAIWNRGNLWQRVSEMGWPFSGWVDLFCKTGRRCLMVLKDCSTSKDRRRNSVVMRPRREEVGTCPTSITTGPWSEDEDRSEKQECREGEVPLHEDIQNVWTVVPVVRKPCLTVRCFDCQILPDGNAHPVRICLPAVLGKMFGIAFTCHNRGDMWVRQQNVIDCAAPYEIWYGKYIHNLSFF